MQAIRTEYFPPGNKLPARVKATASGRRSVYVTEGDATDEAHRTVESFDNERQRWHTMAMQRLCAKLDWTYTWHRGDLDNGFVFVAETDGGKITT